MQLDTEKGKTEESIFYLYELNIYVEESCIHILLNLLDSYLMIFYNTNRF